MSIVQKALDKVVTKLNKTAQIDKASVERILKNNQKAAETKKQG